jgi:hypothetical protein
MLQQGTLFVKYTKDGKDKKSRHFWVTDSNRVQTIHWDDAKPSSPLATKCLCGTVSSLYKKWRSICH